MALLAPSARVLCRDICAGAREAAATSSAPACSTVGGARSSLAFGVWRGGGRGRRRGGGGGVRAAAAYLWDASVPVEMDEIDSMDKLDAALATSADNNLPVVIDWYHLCLCPTYLPVAMLFSYLFGYLRSPVIPGKNRVAAVLCIALQPFILPLGCLGYSVVPRMASWCRKCIYLKPKLEKIAGEYPGVRFYFVDVNKVPQALVKRGNISKMPTIQLWKDGEWKEEVIGGDKAWLVMDHVREMIQKYK